MMVPGPEATVADNFTESSTLTVRIEGPWATFDPAALGNLPSSQIVPALYDRLIAMGPDGKLVPYLASSWEASSSILKFTLRKGVTCSDETPLTASAVAQSFDRLLGITDPKTRPASVPGLFGPGPFTVNADDAAGIFTLNLGTPFSEALTGLAIGTGTYVVCPKGLMAGALDDAAYGSGQL
jgi:peptide/nickel transport system substrate-binding protein